MDGHRSRKLGHGRVRTDLGARQSLRRRAGGVGVAETPMNQQFLHDLRRLGTVKLEEPLKNQARYFLNAIKKGKIDVSDGTSGLDVVRIIEAIQQSLKERGAPIKVE